MEKFLVVLSITSILICLMRVGVKLERKSKYEGSLSQKVDRLTGNKPNHYFRLELIVLLLSFCWIISRII